MNLDFLDVPFLCILLGLGLGLDLLDVPFLASFEEVLD